MLQPDDHELRGLQRREADDDVHDPEVDVVLRRRLAVARHEIRLARRLALERPLTKEVVHEGAHVHPDLRPQRLVVGLEDHPCQPAGEALLDEQRGAAHRHVLVLVGSGIGAAQCARAPHHAPVHREAAQAVDAEWVEQAVLRIGHLDAQPGDAVERGVDAGRGLPDTAPGIGASDDARDHAARGERVDLPAERRVDLADAREVDRGIARIVAGEVHGGEAAPRGGDGRPGGPAVHEQQRATPCAVAHRLLVHVVGHVAAPRIGRDAEQIEEVGLLERVEARLVREAALDVGSSEPDDDGLAAAIQEEVAHCVAERHRLVQSAEGAFEVADARDRDRLIHRAAARLADERGDRGRHAGDRAHAAREFLDVHAGVADGIGHTDVTSGMAAPHTRHRDVQGSSRCIVTALTHEPDTRSRPLPEEPPVLPRVLRVHGGGLLVHLLHQALRDGHLAPACARHRTDPVVPDVGRPAAAHPREAVRLAQARRQGLVRAGADPVHHHPGPAEVQAHGSSAARTRPLRVRGPGHQLTGRVRHPLRVGDLVPQAAGDPRQVHGGHGVPDVHADHRPHHLHLPSVAGALPSSHRGHAQRPARRVPDGQRDAGRAEPLGRGVAQAVERLPVRARGPAGLSLVVPVRLPVRRVATLLHLVRRALTHLACARQTRGLQCGYQSQHDERA